MSSRMEFFLWAPNEIASEPQPGLKGPTRPTFSERIRPLILMYKLFGLVSFSYVKKGQNVELVQHQFGFWSVTIKSCLITATVYLWGADPQHWRRQLDLTIFWLLLGASAYTENCLLDSIQTIDKFDSEMYQRSFHVNAPLLPSGLLCAISTALLTFTAVMHILLYSHLSDKLYSKRTLIQCLNYPLKTPRFTDCLISLVGVVFYIQFIKRFTDLNTRWRDAVTEMKSPHPHKKLEAIRLMHHDLCRANLSFNYYHGLQFLIFFLSIFLKLVIDLVFLIYLYIPDIELECVVYVGHLINFTLFLVVSGSLLRVKQRIYFEVQDLNLTGMSSKCVSQVILYLGQIKTDRCEVVANGFAHFDRQFIISIVSSVATALIVIMQMGSNIFHLTQSDIEDACC